METTPRSDPHASEAGLARLRCNLTQLPAVPDPAEETAANRFDATPIDHAAMELEVGRLRKRLAIWEICLDHVRAGARTWTDVQQAMTPQDIDRIDAICDGVPLRDVLLHLP
jgi:hypothetical protein